MSALFRKLDPDSPCQRFEYVDKEESVLTELDQYTVVIDVKACGLSYISSKVLSEVFCKRPSPQYPASWEASGIVTQVGSQVTRLHPGDRVAGLLPLDSPSTACAKTCSLHEADVVKLPDLVSFEQAAACVGDGVKAYTALYYLARIQHGDTVLFTQAHAHWITLAMQLTKAANAKVLAVVNAAQEKTYLENLNIDSMIEYTEKPGQLLSTVSEETGGMGVNVILDNGVRLFTTEMDCQQMGEDMQSPLPTKHDIISCLGVGGRWITSHPSLQLDPQNSELLFLRGASLSFLFEHMWTLTSSQQGKLQSILRSIMQKLSEGSLKPNITRLVSLKDAAEVLDQLNNDRFGKVVVQID